MGRMLPVAVITALVGSVLAVFLILNLNLQAAGWAPPKYARPETSSRDDSYLAEQVRAFQYTTGSTSTWATLFREELNLTDETQLEMSYRCTQREFGNRSVADMRKEVIGANTTIYVVLRRAKGPASGPKGSVITEEECPRSLVRQTR